MQRILIVGAGQSGLQLALSLREPQHANQYAVTVLSGRKPAEIRDGRIMSTQCMFHPALQNERAHGLNLWENQAPRIGGIGLSVAGEDGTPALNWLGLLDNFAQSVDQRIKMSTWLEVVEQRGGTVEYREPTPELLDEMARDYDLVVVAAGRGPLAELFERDPSRSPYTAPQRALAAAYVHGAGRRPEHPDTDAVRFNVIPGVGELFIIPGYTFSGACEMPLFEGIPGGPLDCWSGDLEPAEHWAKMRDLMRQWVPWEYERFKDAQLTDQQATLAGRVTPVVRKPVGQLPSGTPVLGMADVVVTNDPISGQGANNASKFAQSYLNSILEHGDRPFDPAWMAEAFERYWAEASVITTWTNNMLQPPPGHVMQVFGAAAMNPGIRNNVANSFANPNNTTLGWFLDPAKAENLLHQQPQTVNP
ncbi:FAD-binding oxidoreductase [Saccharopolyspora sp. K220]|uniref:styrene monooxygenase/indole monooxygenase family protein n=1 Tax=Saccharopolyspora soli TaxID=2926618 RepID=UPI001F584A6B|nr:styrene monooxygenase/indole monooxygenase family protein [Saccharopolyspora soli]MCI2416633.1 FAD-binding oxidoreductase [Saccharopolyspora soli]